MGFIFLTIVFAVALFATTRAPNALKANHRGGDQVSLEKPKRWVAIALIVLYVFFVITRTFFVVGPGEGQVGITFGSLHQRAYEPGINVALPVTDRVGYNLRRLAVSFQSGGAEGTGAQDDLLAQTEDRVPVTLDVTFAFQLSPRWLPWVYAHIGGPDTLESSLLMPAARSAVRPAVAGFTMDQALGTAGRIELAEAMQTECTREIVTALTALGLTEEQARQAIVCLPVQLRRVEPPGAVQQAQAERQAAQIGVETASLNVQRETQLAQAQAARGQGLANLQASAPSGWTPSQIADVVEAQAFQALAVAEQRRADALQAAVDGNRVQIMVIPGNGAVSIPQPSPPTN